MALINCKKCGHLISDKAQRCPKCGFIQSYEEEQYFHTDKENTQADFSIEKSNKKSWKIIFIILTILIISCAGIFYIYYNMGNGNKLEDSSILPVDTTIVEQSHSTIEDENISKNEGLNTEFDGLKVISLIENADSSKPPFNSVVIRNDWRSQILNLGFVQGDTEEEVYKGYDGLVSETSIHYYLNLPDNRIELIHKKSPDESFSIIFENLNTLEKFINSLHDFGYKERKFEGGIRLFDKIKDEQFPAGIEWEIDGCSVRSINSDC